MTTNLTIQTDDPAVIHQLTLLTAGHPHANEPEGTGEAIEHGKEDCPGYTGGLDEGWNEALDAAREELSMNLDTLIGIAQRAAEDEDADIRTALFEVIDQRVSELKR